MHAGFGLFQQGHDAGHREWHVAAQFGARFIVCEMGLRSLGMTRAELRRDVPFTVAGIVTLLEETKPGMHLLTL